MAGTFAIKCDLDDAPYVYEMYERQGFIRDRSFAVLVFEAPRRPTQRMPKRG